MSLKVQLGITLPQAITGEQLMRAVQKVAGEEYFHEMSSVTDDWITYEVGVNSKYPYRDLVIAVDIPGNTDITPADHYFKVFVIYKEHGGSKFAIGYDNHSIIEAMTEFRDRLEKELKFPLPGEEPIATDRQILFDWKGQNYQVGMRAYDINCIVLPDGTVLAAGGWLESYPPKPDGLLEASHPYKGRKSAVEIAKIMNGELAVKSN